MFCVEVVCSHFSPSILGAACPFKEDCIFGYVAHTWQLQSVPVLDRTIAENAAAPSVPAFLFFWLSAGWTQLESASYHNLQNQVAIQRKVWFLIRVGDFGSNDDTDDHEIWSGRGKDRRG